MRIELIIATYNSPHALDLCLTGVMAQETLPGSICIADDGSGPETTETVAKFRDNNPDMSVRHVWHEDRGFEKAAILNKALATSMADFVIFIDGDVLIHPTFITRHLALARPNRFSTGSLIRLNAETTAIVTPDMVRSGLVFDRRWLREHDTFKRLGSWLKAMPFPFGVQRMLDTTSPVQKALCGANASLFRADALAVNGFDEAIKYGGSDKEFGIRLTNAGILGQHLRYTAPLVHLDHPRGYKNDDEITRHKQMIKKVRANNLTWTANGIQKVEKPV